MTYVLIFIFGVCLGAALMWLFCAHTEAKRFVELWDLVDERMQERLRARRASRSRAPGVRRVSETELESYVNQVREFSSAAVGEQGVGETPEAEQEEPTRWELLRDD